MSQTSLGLQWKLAVIFLGVSLLSSGMVAVGYFAGVKLGLEPASAWGAGIAAGAAAGLLGSITGFMVARSVKRRLWDAGDLAQRIAAGDFGMRLPVDEHDEVGWLEEQLNAMAAHLETAVGNLHQLAEQNRRLAEEAGRGAALEERARLARDLHDTVNQQLFVLAMRAAATRRKLEKAGGEGHEFAPELAALEELARQAHGEARKLILQLRPTTLEQQGLGPALREYVHSVAAKEGWLVEDAIDQTIRVGEGPGENLFRVAQEALNNISKHANARTIGVGLTREDNALVLTVRDDGEGFDLRAGVRPTAVGLKGMHERVEAMGGHMKLKSAKGQGTTITVQLPLAAEGGNGQ